MPVTPKEFFRFCLDFSTGKNIVLIHENKEYFPLKYFAEFNKGSVTHKCVLKCKNSNSETYARLEDVYERQNSNNDQSAN